MKITVKTTQQKVFQLDVDPSDNIAALKQKISDSQGHPPSTQKLIYSGKILADDKTVESCGIKEKDFLVLMVSKAKPVASAQPVSTTPSTSQPAQAPLAATVQPTQPEAPVPPTPAVTTTPAAVSALSDPTSSFLSGEPLQRAIDNMVEMGFPRDQVLQAMRASFNNPDRAGIPAHLEQPSPQPPSHTPAPLTSTTPSSPPAPAPAPNQPQNLFQLAQQQQGAPTSLPGSGATGPASAARGPGTPQQLREVLESNPGALQAIIHQVAQRNPELAQQLSENPDALFRLLEGGPVPGGLDDAGEDDLPPGAHVVSVTPEEQAAIVRLESLGFTRQQAIEAYLACDKNEELAANYLFENSFED